MPPRKLVWYREAVNEYFGLLARRTDKLGVRSCVEQNLLAVAEDLSLAQQKAGPGGFYIYRFTCTDGDAGIPLQAVLASSNGLLGVLSCNTIRF